MAALTGDGGAVPLGIRHQQLVFQTATADPLRTNQNQRLPPEGRDLGNLFIYPQLVAVKFYSESGGKNTINKHIKQQTSPIYARQKLCKYLHSWSLSTSSFFSSYHPSQRIEDLRQTHKTRSYLQLWYLSLPATSTNPLLK